MIRGESPPRLKPILFVSCFSLTVIFAVIFGRRGRFLNQIKTASLKMKGYKCNSS